MREHHIEIETEKDYEELKLKNVANALYEMNYNVCCEYCTEKKCNNKVIYDKCMDGITDYFREILEIKKEKSGYK